MLNYIGYNHGPCQCRVCFSGRANVLALVDWRLHNNPGYYGSRTPKILVLGFFQRSHLEQGGG